MQGSALLDKRRTDEEAMLFFLPTQALPDLAQEVVLSLLPHFSGSEAKTPKSSNASLPTQGEIHPSDFVLSGFRLIRLCLRLSLPPALSSCEAVCSSPSSPPSSSPCLAHRPFVSLPPSLLNSLFLSGIFLSASPFFHSEFPSALVACMHQATTEVSRQLAQREGPVAKASKPERRGRDATGGHTEGERRETKETSEKRSSDGEDSDARPKEADVTGTTEADFANRKGTERALGKAALEEKSGPPFLCVADGEAAEFESEDSPYIRKLAGEVEACLADLVFRDRDRSDQGNKRRAQSNKTRKGVTELSLDLWKDGDSETCARREAGENRPVCGVVDSFRW